MSLGMKVAILLNTVQVMNERMGCFAFQIDYSID